MAFLIRSNTLKNITPVLFNQIKCASYHYPDWKPGPCPKTKEEREAAAKKYGMLPEEYEPFPDDGSGFGDYPNVPLVSDDMKDQNLPWDTNNSTVVRNWNEPVSVAYLGYTLDKGTTKPEEFGFWTAFWHGLVKILGAATLFYMIPDMRYKPVAPKQLPHEGVTHYTFELEQ